MTSSSSVTGGSNKMLEFDNLALVTAGKYLWRIKVRVERIWDTYSGKDRGVRCLNLLLIDEKQTRKAAVIFSENIPRLEKEFEEGGVYIIYNFSVKTYDKMRVVRSLDQLVLTNHTDVSRITDVNSTINIMPMDFDYYDIEDILNTKQEHDSEDLIDVIGVVQGVNNRSNFTAQDGSKRPHCTFSITDGSCSIRTCLWGDLGIRFYEDYIKHATEEPVIVILASCKVGIFKDQRQLSSVNPTRYYINSTHPSVEEFKESFLGEDSRKLSQDQPIIGVIEETSVLKLGALKKLNDTYVGKKFKFRIIVKTLTEDFGWHYRACTGCKKDVEQVGRKFRCDGCKRNIPIPDTLFRLVVLAEDETGLATFVLSNRDIVGLIGKTVYEVLAEQDKGGDVQEFPEVIKALQGKQYTVSVVFTAEQVRGESSNYYVEDITEITETSGIVDEWSPQSTVQDSAIGSKGASHSTNTHRQKIIDEDATLRRNLDADMNNEDNDLLQESSVKKKKVKIEKVTF